jgi:hypothetical protein
MSRVFRVVSTPGLMTATTEMTPANWRDHFAVRVGIRRGDHRVPPGLYRVGSPTAESPVFVTANYSLSFDALRTSLRGINGYILVLDTRGVNVWCAAGKRTFGTREVIRRVEATKLAEVVSHRKLILPQLGAPGVAAHEVRKQTGFTVEYGPVRASDLPEYLKTRRATPEMRRVRFTLLNRLVLTPVDVTQTFLPMLVAMGIAFLIGGVPYMLAAMTVVLSGDVLFPALLPWLPSKDFSSKGGFLGMVAAIPLILSVLLGHADWNWYRQLGQSVGYLLTMSPSVAFIALNFTGASTFTSRTGVRKEMATYIRPMAVSFVLGIAALIVFAFVK